MTDTDDTLDPAGGAESAPETARSGAGDPDALARLEAERNDLLDRLRRTAAEYDNYQKRTRRERDELSRYVRAEFARDVLPLFDGLDRALQTADAAPDLPALVEGLRIVRDQFTRLFEQKGLEPIPGAGHPFDPRWHEALFRVETADVAPNTVIEEFERGYRLGDVVVRPSRVSVAAAPSSAPPAGEAPPSD